MTAIMRGPARAALADGFVDCRPPSFGIMLSIRMIAQLMFQSLQCLKTVGGYIHERTEAFEHHLQHQLIYLIVQSEKYPQTPDF